MNRRKTCGKTHTEISTYQINRLTRAILVAATLGPVLYSTCQLKPIAFFYFFLGGGGRDQPVVLTVRLFCHRIGNDKKRDYRVLCTHAVGLARLHWPHRKRIIYAKHDSRVDYKFNTSWTQRIRVRKNYNHYNITPGQSLRILFLPIVNNIECKRAIK